MSNGGGFGKERSIAGKRETTFPVVDAKISSSAGTASDAQEKTTASFKVDDEMIVERSSSSSRSRTPSSSYVVPLRQSVEDNEEYHSASTSLSTQGLLHEDSTERHLNNTDPTPSPHDEEKRKKDFPWKLHVMLEEAENANKNHIVSWNPDGKSFKVHKPDVFVKEVAPKYFNHKNYRSFQKMVSSENTAKAAQSNFYRSSVLLEISLVAAICFGMLLVEPGLPISSCSLLQCFMSLACTQTNANHHTQCQPPAS
jgi:hypothetical protein